MKRNGFLGASLFVGGLAVGVLTTVSWRAASAPEVSVGAVVPAVAVKVPEASAAETDQETDDGIIYGTALPDPAVGPSPVQAERQPEAAPEEQAAMTPEQGLAALRERSPEAYRKLMERRTAWAMRQRERSADMQEFVYTVDPALLQAEELETHEVYVEALKRYSDAREAVVAAREAGTLPEPETMTALRESLGTLQGYAQQERRLLLEATARSIGLEDTAQFAELIGQIIEATDSFRRDR